MRIAIVGSGYVGLATGVSLAEVGHHVTCIDKDAGKIKMLQSGKSPIYEPGLEAFIIKNLEAGYLSFSNDIDNGCSTAEIIYITVGTPQNKDGTTDLTDIKEASIDIAKTISQDVIVVTKSTVPVGTSETLKQLIEENLVHPVSIEIVSNPEFLREGSAIHDTFNGDRIVIGATNNFAAGVIEEVNRPFNVPIVKTELRDAEMIKYASNAFLATKISFINEIATICEKVGANVDHVASAMGMDKRIGHQFLQAGIGYGGSCFPKDTKALIQLSGNVEHDFELLKSVVKVNNNQQDLLVEKAKQRFKSLTGRRVTLLGLAFKPNTNDMREAASITVVDKLIAEKAEIIVYDPVANETAKRTLPEGVNYADSFQTAVKDAEVVFILTEWEEFKQIDLSEFKRLMKIPIIFDGRNCFDLDVMRVYEIEYHSIGRPSILR
ncbi:UDP-glucose dehydrogenase family protein [Virgibacillus sp. DJP39]|uniref:UDP-glucose dehydrogenase family protein n=1 Tax=Virgibacillus sp. DJP39 TaxID=3409790 RepID=UPI003BB666D1